MFSIKEDLQGRELCQQAEILWISGPTAFNAEAVAKVLGVSTTEVAALVRQSVESRKPNRRRRK